MHAASFSDAKEASASTTPGAREAVARKAEERPLASAVSGIETASEDTAMERTRSEEVFRRRMAKTAVRHPFR